MFVSEDRASGCARSALLAGSSCLDLGYGRFMQTDPLGYDDGLNWYNYAHSDPVNGVDPSGTCESTVNGITYTWHYANSTSCSASSSQLAAGISAYNAGNPGDVVVRGNLMDRSSSAALFGATSYNSSSNTGSAATSMSTQTQIQQVAYNGDRCMAKVTPRIGGKVPYFVSPIQLQSIAQAKFLQHSFPLSPSGRVQSTFGGAMYSGDRVASGAAFLIETRSAVPTGNFNSRIAGDLGVNTGLDAFSFSQSTNYLTVIVGPPTGSMVEGLPVRPVVSIYPGC